MNPDQTALGPYCLQYRIKKKKQKIFCLFVWFDSLHPINNLSVMYGQVVLGWTSTKLGLMCLAQGHNAMTRVRLQPMAPRSWVKHSTTEPLRSRTRRLIRRSKLWLAGKGLTLYLLVSSTDKFYKQFGPRSCPTNCWAWSGYNLFDTQMVFLKGLFWKKSAEDKKGEQFPRGQRVVVHTGSNRILFPPSLFEDRLIRCYHASEWVFVRQWSHLQALSYSEVR